MNKINTKISFLITNNPFVNQKIINCVHYDTQGLFINFKSTLLFFGSKNIFLAYSIQFIYNKRVEKVKSGIYELIRNLIQTIPFLMQLKYPGSHVILAGESLNQGNLTFDRSTT